MDHQTAHAATAPHQKTAGRNRILVCTSCKPKGCAEKPGLDLIARLRAALESHPFEVAGVACMAGCNHPCTVAFQGSGKASYLFGEIDPEADLDDLLSFAHLYDALHDGWCSSVDRPGKLRRTTLARMPALPAPSSPSSKSAPSSLSTLSTAAEVPS